MTATRFAASLLVLMYLASSTVVAQCEPEWLPPPAPLVGTGCGIVNRATTWDPDGGGPAHSVLVVGGDFTNIGEQAVPNVGVWDGVRWAPLGDLDGVVNALAVYRGDLIVGGRFALDEGWAHPQVLARWSGSEWESVGSEVDSSVASVTAMAVIGDELWVGGSFAAINGVSCGNIAAWNGTSWRTLAGGMNDAVAAISATPLGVVAGGAFTQAGEANCSRVALWDGSAWRPMGAGVDQPVYAVCTYNDDILIGGRFTASVNQARRLARWNAENATWEEFGGGANGTVNSLDVVDETLYVTGVFSTLGGVNAYRAGMRTGSGWLPIFDPTLRINPKQFISLDGQLCLVGGTCSTASVMYRDDQGNWNAAGPVFGRADVTAMAVIDGELHIAGSIGDSPGQTRDVLRLNGSRWEPLGVGDAWIRVITQYQGRLVVGGAVLRQWTGSEWAAFGTDVIGQVHTMIEYGGELVVGGQIRRAGDFDVWGIARWNGTTWQMMGNELYDVYSLAVFRGELYAAGLFWIEGANGSCRNIARWDGARWQAIGTSGLSPNIAVALTVFDDLLIAAGSFTEADGTPVNRIAAWDGTNWRSLEGGVDSSVSALTTFGDQLIAAGFFGSAGGQPVSRIARWDGIGWHAFPGRFDGLPHTLVEFNGDLLVGGTFSQVGGYPSNFLTRWGSRPVGDLDDDRAVGIQDLANLLASFGACPGDENYNAAAAGLAGDECVGLDDLAVLLQAFGSTCP
ncbi:MAG: hypothetical protein AMXMBFR47_25100 [Planctomycetota bacterium]